MLLNIYPSTTACFVLETPFLIQTRIRISGLWSQSLNRKIKLLSNTWLSVMVLIASNTWQLAQSTAQRQKAQITICKVNTRRSLFLHLKRKSRREGGNCSWNATCLGRIVSLSEVLRLAVNNLIKFLLQYGLDVGVERNQKYQCTLIPCKGEQVEKWSRLNKECKCKYLSSCMLIKFNNIIYSTGHIKSSNSAPKSASFP